MSQTPPSSGPAAGEEPAAGVVPRLAVVVPMFNEAENVAPLVAEIDAAIGADLPAEIVVVDDHSDDGTPAALAAAMRRHPRLRVLRHSDRSGQSAAVRSGVRAARAPLIATLDGDLQNDPADIMKLYRAWQAARARDGIPGIVAGQRIARRDTLSKRLTSRIANGVREAMLRDGTRDTGCGLKLFERDLFLDLPYFNGLHRFLPALVRGRGRTVVTVDVGHRPRVAGISKYGLWNRLWVGIADLLMVFWIIRRSRLPRVVEERPPATTSQAATQRERE